MLAVKFVRPGIGVGTFGVVADEELVVGWDLVLLLIVVVGLEFELDELEDPQETIHEGIIQAIEATPTVPKTNLAIFFFLFFSIINILSNY